MRLWCTDIRAIDPIDGQMKRWSGPIIEAISREAAEAYVQENGLGFCSIDGELVAEIPCKPGTYEPDFTKMTDYEKARMN